MTVTPSQPEIYQGQFGEFTLTPWDLQSVQIYRAGLAIAAGCLALATALVFWKGNDPTLMTALTPLFALFAIALGVSLATIHIYLKLLHRVLQIFWLIGTVSALIFAINFPEPLAIAVYEHPVLLLGVGFIFAALTGIFFKEGFCFNRLETKLLTPLVPTLLLAHLFGILPVTVEKGLLGAWALLFLIFAFRKLIQDLPDDIGDKSVFEYLKQQRSQALS